MNNFTRLVSRVIALLCSLFAVTNAVADPWATVDTTYYSTGYYGTYNGTEPYYVNYSYRIGLHEVTQGQWVEFLNAKASKDDPHALYYDYQYTIYDYGISRTYDEVAKIYIYSVTSAKENFPVCYIRRSDAMRYCNWLHNGKGDGDTEDGAYDMSANPPIRKAEAGYFLPNYREWIKAAYDKNYRYGSAEETLWDYPNSSDVAPTTSNANIGRFANHTSDPRLQSVGNYGTASHYGLKDLIGNVEEWVENNHSSGSIYGTALGGYYGHSSGSTYFRYSEHSLALTNTNYRASLTSRSDRLGFRVAGIAAPTVYSTLVRNFTFLPGETGALGTGPITGSVLSYQWYQGEPGDISQPIAGATSLTFTPPILSQTTVYWMRVSNIAGYADSGPIVAVVVTPYPTQGDDNILTNVSSDLSGSIGRVYSTEIANTSWIIWSQGGRIYSVPMQGGVRNDLTSGLVNPGVFINAPFLEDNATSLYGQNTRLQIHGDYVYYSTGASSPYEIYRSPIAGGGPQLLANDLFRDYEFSVTHDSSRVVYRSSTGLNTVATSGGNPSVLIDSADYTLLNIVVSPDSSRVAFTAIPAVGTSVDAGVFVVPISGGAVTRLNHSPHGGNKSLSQIAINATSSHVIYKGDDLNDNNYQLFTVPITGGSIALLESNGSDFKIAPDGSRVYVMATPAGATNQGLYSYGITGGSAVRHTPNTSYINSSPLPQFTDNGKAVVRVNFGSDDDLAYHGFVFNSTEIIICNSADSGFVRVGEPLESTANYYPAHAILPNNLGVLYQYYQAPGHDINRVDINGGFRTNLDNETHRDRGVWASNQLVPSSDGQRFLFVKPGDLERQDLYSQSIYGGNLRRMYPLMPEITHPYEISNVDTHVGAVGDGNSGWFVADLDVENVNCLYITRMPEPTPPSISGLTSGATIDPGTAIDLEVVAEGTPIITYQWYEGDTGNESMPIGGATGPTYNTGALTGMQRKFWVKLSNSVGDIDSATITFDIRQPPTITQEPAGGNVLEDENFELVVHSDGSPALTYQWYEGISGDTSAPINGANLATYLTVPLLADTDFWVRVSNDLGSDDSATATVTVTPRVPVITSATTATATVGQLFGYRITGTYNPVAFGGTSLPDWLNVNPSTGWATGTPSASGTVNLTVTATNDRHTGTAPLEINVLPAPPTFTTSPAISDGRAGVEYRYIISATGEGVVLTANGLPAGMTFADGVLGGVPTDAGEYSITFTANNGGGSTDLLVDIAILEPYQPPVMTSASSAVGQVGSPFSFSAVAQVDVTGYLSQNLPTWLTLDGASGQLTGTPVAPGTYEFQLYATGPGGGGPVQEFNLTVLPHPSAPVVSSVNAAIGRKGAPFSFQLTGTNSPSTWSLTPMPDGLSLDAGTGQITGNPTGYGTFNATLTANNAFGSSAGADFTFTILPPPLVPVISSSNIYRANLGDVIDLSFEATNSPTSFVFTGLPPWLTQVNSTGQITGNANLLQDGTFRVHAVNGDGPGPGMDVTLYVDVHPDSPSLPTSHLFEVYGGIPFSEQATAEPAATSYIFSGLPAGVTADSSSGAIGGVLGTPGDYAFTVIPTNASGNGRTATWTIRVLAPPDAPAVSNASIPPGQVGQAYSFQPTASPLANAFKVTGLPAGLDYSLVTGLISGTPTKYGSYSIAISAANVSGYGAVTQLTLLVKPIPEAPRLAGKPAYSLQQGAEANYDFDAVPGPLVSFSATGLPPGMTLDAAQGKLTGKPTEAGQYTVTLKAVNNFGESEPLDVLVTVAPAIGLPRTAYLRMVFGLANERNSVFLRATEMPTSLPLPAGNFFEVSGMPSSLKLNPHTGKIEGYIVEPARFRARAINNAGPGAWTHVELNLNSRWIRWGGPSYYNEDQIVGPSYVSGDYLGTASINIEARVNSNYKNYFIHYFSLPFANSSYWIATNDSSASSSFNTHLRPPYVLPGVNHARVGASSRSPYGFVRTVTRNLTVVANLRADTPRIIVPDTLYFEQGAVQVQVAATEAISQLTFHRALYDRGSRIIQFIRSDASTPDTVTLPSFQPGSYEFTVYGTTVSGKATDARRVTVVIRAAGSAPEITSAVNDGYSEVTAQAYDGTYSAQMAEVSADTILNGQVGEEFAYQFTSSDSVDRWEVTSLPSGLAFNQANARIAGVPSVPGDFTVIATAISSDNSQSDPKEFTINISPVVGAPAMQPPFAISAQVGDEVSIPVTSDDPNAYLDILESPEFFAFDAEGKSFRCIPTEPGQYLMVVQPSGLGGVGSQTNYTLNVTPADGAPALLAPGNSAGNAGVAASFTPIASDFGDNIQLDGSVPGMGWNDVTGTLNGTPTVPGDYQLRLRGWNQFGPGDWVGWNVSIAPAVGTAQVTSASDVDIPVGQEIDLQVLTDSGYSFINIENLPDGLIFDPYSGRITGRIQAGTDSIITLTTVNSYGQGSPQYLELSANNKPLTQWRFEQFGSSLLNQHISDDFSDPDKDGLNNLLEYGLGYLPMDSSSRGSPVATIDQETNTSIFTYTRPKNTTDLSYHVIASPSLDGSQTDLGQGILVDETAMDETRQVTIPMETKGFFRLKIQEIE